MYKYQPIILSPPPSPPAQFPDSLYALWLFSVAFEDISIRHISVYDNSVLQIAVLQISVLHNSVSDIAGLMRTIEAVRIRRLPSPQIFT